MSDIIFAINNKIEIKFKHKFNFNTNVGIFYCLYFFGAGCSMSTRETSKKTSTSIFGIISF